MKFGVGTVWRDRFGDQWVIVSYDDDGTLYHVCSSTLVLSKDKGIDPEGTIIHHSSWRGAK